MLPDLLDEDLELVICGTAVGATSASKQQYYAQPSNQFWQVLYEVGLTSRLLTPREYAELLEEGIGLTDLVKKQAGMDSDLQDCNFGASALRAKLHHYQPQVLCFNGKRAAQEFLRRKVDYGVQPEQVGRTQIYVAPSTSGAARRWWDIKWWEELAAFVKGAG